MANPFVHVELSTTDVGNAKTFYGKLLDWKLEDVPMGSGGSYTMINVGKGTGGGIMKNPVPGRPSAWLAYVEVGEPGGRASGNRILHDSTPRSLAHIDHGVAAAASHGDVLELPVKQLPVKSLRIADIGGAQLHMYERIRHGFSSNRLNKCPLYLLLHFLHKLC